MMTTIKERANSVSSRRRIDLITIPTSIILARAALNPIVIRIGAAKPPIETIPKVIVPATAGSPVIVGKDTRIIRITAISRPTASPTMINYGNHIIAASRTIAAHVFAINQQRWRSDREYRDAYFAGLHWRAGADRVELLHVLDFGKRTGDERRLGAERRVKLSGRVQKTARVNIKGTNQQHQQAQIRTSQGDRYWVDLGPADEARQLDLGEGDQLTVKGIAVKAGDHSIIFATSANANDERLSFDYYSPSELSEQQSSDNRRHRTDSPIAPANGRTARKRLRVPQRKS